MSDPVMTKPFDPVFPLNADTNGIVLSDPGEFAWSVMPVEISLACMVDLCKVVHAKARVSGVPVFWARATDEVGLMFPDPERAYSIKQLRWATRFLIGWKP